MAKPIPQIKRPTIPSDVAERFINPEPAAAQAPPALAVVQKSPRPSAPAAPSVAPDDSTAGEAPVTKPSRRQQSNGRKVTKLTTGEEVRKVTLYLPAELDIALSVHCATNGLVRSDVVVAALRKVVKPQ